MYLHNSYNNKLHESNKYRYSFLIKYHNFMRFKFLMTQY